MIKKYLLVIFVLLLILIFACTQTTQQISSGECPTGQPNCKDFVVNPPIDKDDKEVKPSEGPKLNPTLNIISPKDGELIKNSTATIKLQAENFNIVPIGTPVKDREGHFHVWLDSEKKLGHQTTFTFENIVSGKHAVVAELLKSNHSSLSPKVTKTITITVESDYAPPKPEHQQGISEFTVEADDNGFYPSTIKAKIGDKVIIHFKFRDDSIYFAGLDIQGPFPTIQYKLKGQQPLTAEFTMKDETRIVSYWPASGVKKATLIVEVEK